MSTFLAVSIFVIRIEMGELKWHSATDALWYFSLIVKSCLIDSAAVSPVDV